MSKGRSCKVKTRSETAFETFLSDNKLKFERIKEASSPRPDYMVQANDWRVVFEIKELAEDENFRAVNDPSSRVFRVHSRIVGDHVRSKISEAKKQIQYAAKQGLPSVLLIYNCIDPLFLFGTEDHDFIAGMYGEFTVLLDRDTKKVIGEPYHGRNKSVSEVKNTSFSAAGRLWPCAEKMSVTLFENAFAKVKLPENLPSCFEVKRVKIT